jgi:hypothetical protein
MKKLRLISYYQNNERIKFLKNNIKNFEEFYSLESLTKIYMDFCEEYRQCKKKNIDMNLINTLELYNANLEYYYRLI